MCVCVCVCLTREQFSSHFSSLCLCALIDRFEIGLLGQNVDAAFVDK